MTAGTYEQGENAFKDFKRYVLERLQPQEIASEESLFGSTSLATLGLLGSEEVEDLRKEGFYALADLAFLWEQAKESATRLEMLDNKFYNLVTAARIITSSFPNIGSSQGKPFFKLILAGLDSKQKGKLTSFLTQRLVTEQSGTEGRNTTELRIGERPLFLWDIGGSEVFRHNFIKFANHYFWEVHLILFMINVDQPDRYEDSLSYVRDILEMYSFLGLRPPIKFYFGGEDELTDQSSLNVFINNLKQSLENYGFGDALAEMTSVYQADLRTVFGQTLVELIPTEEWARYSLYRVADELKDYSYSCLFSLPFPQLIGMYDGRPEGEQHLWSKEMLRLYPNLKEDIKKGRVMTKEYQEENKRYILVFTKVQIADQNFFWAGLTNSSLSAMTLDVNKLEKILGEDLAELFKLVGSLNQETTE